MNRMNHTMMAMSILSSTLLLTGMAPASDQPGSGATVFAAALSATTADDERLESIIVLRNPDGEYRAVMKDGQVRVLLDGREVRADRIEREGNRMFVRDADGKVVLNLRVIPGRGLVIADGPSMSAPLLRTLPSPSVTIAPPRGRIGVTLGTIDEAMAGHLNLSPDEVVLVANVIEGAAAEKAGLKKFDIIVEVNGERPVTAESLRQAVQAREPGESITLTVLREGKRHELPITLEPFRVGMDSQRLADVAVRATPFLDLSRDFDPHELAELMREMLTHEHVERWQREGEDLIGWFREQGAEFPAQWRSRARDAEQHVERLRAEIEREVKALLEATEPLEEHLERALDRLEEQVVRLLREARTIGPRSRNIEIIREGDDVKGMVIHPPDAPRRGGVGGGGAGRFAPPPGPQRPTQPSALNQRLDRLESRMERLEGMIEQLLERRSSRGER